MKTFYHLLVNTLIASVINFTVWFAITFYVYLQTKSVAATGFISGIYLVITAISGFWFGSLVDHHKKKKVMLASSLGSLILFSLCFFINLITPATAFKNPVNPVLWLFILLLLLGVTIGNIRNIALTTVITFLVDEKKRDKANGMAGTASGISFLITSVISGFLVGLAGMYYVLLLAVIATVGVLIHLSFIKIPEKNIAHSTNSVDNKIDVRGTIKAIQSVPGLLALIFFTMFNNFLGGVFMALMDAYGLSLVSVQTWGMIWGFLSTAFIIGGLVIARFGLGKNPLRSMFLANIVIWFISSVFTIPRSIYALTSGMFIYLCVVPFIQASEQTIIQKVVPAERQGRVFGFAQSVEQAAAPLTAFLIGPLTQFFFIPFMTKGVGVHLIGSWFGTGPDRGIALVFTVTGILGLCSTLFAIKSKYYRLLTHKYLNG